MLVYLRMDPDSIKICVNVHAVACAVCADSELVWNCTEASSTLVLLILRYMYSVDVFTAWFMYGNVTCCAIWLFGVHASKARGNHCVCVCVCVCVCDVSRENGSISKSCLCAKHDQKFC